MLDQLELLFEAINYPIQNIYPSLLIIIMALTKSCIETL